MRDRLNWRFLLFGTSVITLVCFLDALLESDGLIYFFIFVPFVCLALVALLIVAAISENLRRTVLISSILAAYCVVSLVFFKNHFAIRNAARWSLWSKHYKADILTQPSPTRGELRHIDWDGWGFPGAGDTTVYLVFDPTDSLRAAANQNHSGKFPGIPCSVPSVDRLESQWYAVMFYTGERWGTPHSDCGMNDSLSTMPTSDRITEHS